MFPNVIFLDQMSAYALDFWYGKKTFYTVCKNSCFIKNTFSKSVFYKVPFFDKTLKKFHEKSIPSVYTLLFLYTSIYFIKVYKLRKSFGMLATW